jgi:hypothetical protein
MPSRHGLTLNLPALSTTHEQKSGLGRLRQSLVFGIMELLVRKEKFFNEHIIWRGPLQTPELLTERAYRLSYKYLVKKIMKKEGK